MMLSSFDIDEGSGDDVVVCGDVVEGADIKDAFVYEEADFDSYILPTDFWEARL